MRLLATFLLVVSAGLPLPAQQMDSVGTSALVPAGTGGLEVIDRALVKLSTHRRLMVIGAHPDDEDTTLLAYVGRGLGGEAAYLSLSRGEGGQNLIGAELGVGLGLIRTGELLAAREIEGTRQFFTRAYDFGYTRSLTETFERWPREELLRDAVRAVRRFKPQVVVAIFPGDGRGGHGQHQAAGVIAQEVFESAGLPDRFPELTSEGLPPWQPQAFYRRAWWNRDEATLEFPLDQIDPFSGHSVLQIASQSRSQHRSQDMGTLQRLGNRQGALIWGGGREAMEASSVFGGIDTNLAAIADHIPAGSLHTEVGMGLDSIADLATTTRSGLSPSNMANSVAPLNRLVEGLDQLLDEVAGVESASSLVVVTDLLQEKRQAASMALIAATGVALDAVADREMVAAGETMSVTATLWNSGYHEVEVERVSVVSPAGWLVSSSVPVESEEGVSDLQQWGFEMRVPEEGVPTMPYFLRAPLKGDLYDWQDSDSTDLGNPLDRSPAWVEFDLRVAGSPVLIRREVVYRVRDQAQGEVRLPIRAVPALEVEVAPGMLLWPVGNGRPREVEILIRSHLDGPVAGELELVGDSGTLVLPPPREFQIDKGHGQQIVRLEMQAPTVPQMGRVELTVVASADDGQRYATAFPVLDYPHIRPLALPVVARVEIQTLDLELPQASRIGYVRGASDRVPEILLELGLPVEMLSADDLSVADLSLYDSIVIGSRAYETNPALAQTNGRLLSYVEGGGRLVVQYQQYQFVRGGFAPYPLEIGRPHGRVTDETAPIQMLRPGHPLFATPNQIGSQDWAGWVQERGLYFAESWDSAYLPLLSLQDEGETLEEGALLVANVGEGVYVYTGLSFFRQLPAGVPGAIRLFVNLLSLERS